MANEMARKIRVVEKKELKPVKIIVTHEKPHFDEILAIFLLKKYGKNFFSGIEDACVEMWGEGKMLKEYVGKTAEYLLVEKKMLCVGIGGGEFDEHGNGELTCAHLVAKYIRVDENKELQKILQFCKRVDHDGKSMPFDLHSSLKKIYDFLDAVNEDTQTAFDWTMLAIESEVYAQKRFHACVKEFEKSGRIVNINPIRIAQVESDNTMMCKWIRSAYNRPEVIVKRGLKGNIIILTSLLNIDMRDMIRSIRMQEMQKRNLDVPKWQALEAEGTIPECPWWHFNANNRQIFNGAISAPDVEPSILTLGEVTRAIIAGCKSLVNPCKEKKCVRTCTKFKLGLVACRKKRFNEMKEKI